MRHLNNGAGRVGASAAPSEAKRDRNASHGARVGRSGMRLPHRLERAGLFWSALSAWGVASRCHSTWAPMHTQRFPQLPGGSILPAASGGQRSATPVARPTPTAPPCRRSCRKGPGGDKADNPGCCCHAIWGPELRTSTPKLGLRPSAFESSRWEAAVRGAADVQLEFAARLAPCKCGGGGGNAVDKPAAADSLAQNSQSRLNVKDVLDNINDGPCLGRSFAGEGVAELCSAKSRAERFEVANLGDRRAPEVCTTRKQLHILQSGRTTPITTQHLDGLTSRPTSRKREVTEAY